MISLEPVAQQTCWCPDDHDGQEQPEKELVPGFKEIFKNKFIEVGNQQGPKSLDRSAFSYRRRGKPQ